MEGCGGAAKAGNLAALAGAGRRAAGSLAALEVRRADWGRGRCRRRRSGTKAAAAAAAAGLGEVLAWYLAGAADPGELVAGAAAADVLSGLSHGVK